VTIGGNLGFAAGTLGSALGTAATKIIGTSGDAVPVLNGAATTWAAGATFGGNLSSVDSYASGSLRVGYNSPMKWRNGSAAASDIPHQIVSSTPTTGQGSTLFMIRNAPLGYRLQLARSENTTIGAHTAIANTTSELGAICWTGSDGTDFRDAASIRGYVNNVTVNASGYEGRLEFYLGAPGTGALTKYLTLSATDLSMTGTGTFSGGLVAGSTLVSSPAAGDNSTKIASTAYARAAAPNASYRTILDVTSSHIAGKTAATYGFAQGQPLAVSGTGTLYPLNLIAIAAADYPSVDGLAAKLRVRAICSTNDVAPTGTYTVGLHPVTRPGTSGGAGLCIYTIGAAVSGSTLVFTTPAADATTGAAGTDFALPADGIYCIAVMQTGTVAASAHIHFSAALQMRNA
jgi:hypothetical protein